MVENKELTFAESFSRLSKYISDLSDNTVFHQDTKQKETIANTVKEILSLFLFLANKIGKWDESKVIIDKFKGSFGVSDVSDISFSGHENFSSMRINDEINYLKVCVKNISNIDLDGEIPKSPVPIQVAEPQKKPDAFSVYKSFLSPDEGGIFDSQGGGAIFQDFHAKLTAYKKLDEDINTGKIYIYKKKPNLNIRIKQFLFFLYILGVISSLAFLLTIFVKKVNLTEFKSSIIIAFASIIYLSTSAFHIWKTFSNENFKYSFQKKIFFYSFCFVFPLMCSIIFVSGVESFLDFKGKLLESIFFLIVLMSNGLGWAIYFLGYIYLQPERDEQLLQRTLEKHISDIVSK